MRQEVLKSDLQQAINAHCKGCIYDSLQPGTWRQQVENCTVTKCELYTYRPITEKTTSEIKQAKFDSLDIQEQQRIREYNNKLVSRMRNTAI